MYHHRLQEVEEEEGGSDKWNVSRTTSSDLTNQIYLYMVDKYISNQTIVRGFVSTRREEFG
jgi:hypothetical protein